MHMTFMTAEERAVAGSVSKLGYSNPFLPERIEHERAVLGDDFVPAGPIWTVRTDRAVQNPNVPRIAERVAGLVARLRDRLPVAGGISDEDRLLYDDLVFYLLYDRYEKDFVELVLGGGPDRRVDAYDGFRKDWEHFFGVPGLPSLQHREPSHLFACLFQVRRAFHHTFWHIIGGSMPTARLRAAVWQSIFTHDMRRYQRVLYGRMADFTTLVVGASGTGKELVARAIALSRYIPFDAKTQRFAAHFADLFHPLNLSALSPTIIESELFGHRRGAFTGAVGDRAGWLETCEPVGTVFLDEIGDVDTAIQVKLLRVLQTRHFERLGDTKSLTFRGKIIAATNRDLAREIQAGRFREDFYYRLCSDIIAAPSLAEQLEDSPEELSNLILFIARRVVGEEEAVALAKEVVAWAMQNLGPRYGWPGNVRELEQCVRNVLIRRNYQPTALRAGGVRDELTAAVSAGRLTADELLVRYATLVYSQTGSYLETARRLKLDRRTVKSKVDPDLLAALHAESPGAPPAGARLGGTG